MTHPDSPQNQASDINAAHKPTSTLIRILKYSSLRLAALAAAVAVGVFAAVLLINFGGFIDEIYEERVHMGV